MQCISILKWMIWNPILRHTILHFFLWQKNHLSKTDPNLLHTQIKHTSCSTGSYTFKSAKQNCFWAGPRTFKTPNQSCRWSIRVTWFQLGTLSIFNPRSTVKGGTLIIFLLYTHAEGNFWIHKSRSELNLGLVDYFCCTTKKATHPKKLSQTFAKNQARLIKSELWWIWCWVFEDCGCTWNICQDDPSVDRAHTTEIN